MLLDPGQLRTYEAPVRDAAAPVVATPAHGEPAQAVCLVGRHGVDLEQLFPPLQPDHVYQVPSIGYWSLHEMLLFLLQRTGPADVWMTSWGITAEPLKQVVNAVEEGRIVRLSAYFDSRIRTQCPQAHQLLVAAAGNDPERVTVRLGKNHSKLLLLINDRWSLTVSSSSNLTINPRVEHYVVCTHRSIAEFNRSWIAAAMNDGHPFEAPDTA